MKFSEAKALLDELIKHGSLDENDARKAQDLLMQYFGRSAVELVNAHNYVGALEKFEGMKEAFEQCPDRLRDALMINRFMKSIGIATICKNSLAGNRMYFSRAQNFIEWIETITDGKV